MALAKDNPFRKGLVALLQSIEEQVPLTEGSYLTIRYHLETEEAIVEFNEWVKSNLKEGQCKRAKKVRNNLCQIILVLPRRTMEGTLWQERTSKARCFCRAAQLL